MWTSQTNAGRFTGRLQVSDVGVVNICIRANMSRHDMTQLALAVVVAAGFVALITEERRWRRERLVMKLIEVFGAVTARGRSDPRELVGWAETARMARRRFPDACEELDRAMNGRFPFSDELVETAHARWTTEWLSWERQHDTEYKDRAARLEATLEGVAPDAQRVVRSNLASLEDEKLQTYQQRYETYVQVGTALADMTSDGRNAEG
jgi:hypothetical protein